MAFHPPALTPESSPPRAAHPARLGLAALALGGLAAGLAEAWRTAPVAPDLGWALAFAGVAWGTWTAAALVLAGPAMVGTLAPRRARTDGPSWALWLVALAMCGMAAVPVALALAERWGETIAPELRTWVVVGGTLGVAALALPAAPALVALLHRLTRGRRLPPRWVAAGLAAAGLAATWVLAGIDGRNIPFGMLIFGAGLAGLLPTRPRRWVGWLVPVALLAGGGALIGLYQGSPATIRGPAAEGMLTGLLLERLEAATDDDEDGFGDGFGGLDCDDRDPFVNPAALDVPGNGLDENCQGGDAPRALQRAKLPAPKVKLTELLGPDAPHIVLLVLDAVRADALGSADGALTPHLNRWIARGTRFTRAFSTSSSTRHAVPALLTGRWVGHGEYRETVSLYTVDSKIHTLAEALAEKSYRTAAVMPPFIHGRLLGMGRGFRRYLPFGDQKSLKAAAGRNGPLAVARALEVLNEPYPFATFLYLHLDDAHAPYSKTGATREDDGTPRTRYLNEINRMDADLAPLLDRLEAMQTERPVLLAIVADHGEAFGEHGSFTHGRDLYQAVLHVPLILVGPGVPAGQTNDTPVDLLDLGVTLAQAGGARLRDAEGQGLWGLLAGEPPPAAPRPLFAEMRILHPPYPTWTAVIDWPMKLIQRQDTGQRLLFDLAADPEELTDLTEARAEDTSRLAGLLLQFVELGMGAAGRFDAPGAPREP